jgi:hypothetical protein
MATQTKDLWKLVKYRPEVDPDDLAAAIQEEVGKEPLDYRTRLLIRDSVVGLKDYWGDKRLADWLAASPVRDRIEAICREEFERPGFPFRRGRIMEKTDPETIRSYLRDLAVKVRRPIQIQVGGSAALILPGYLSRATDDIDVVDEVPAEIRSQPGLLDELEHRYRLRLAHFQRHYLPMGWEQRLHYLDSFGELHVYLLDVYDVFLSKLFSIRAKDKDDMRMLLPQLDKDMLVRRLHDTTAAMLAAPDLHQRAKDNWYVLYGEALPT